MTTTKPYWKSLDSTDITKYLETDDWWIDGRHLDTWKPLYIKKETKKENVIIDLKNIKEYQHKKIINLKSTIKITKRIKNQFESLLVASTNLPLIGGNISGKYSTDNNSDSEIYNNGEYYYEELINIKFDPSVNLKIVEEITTYKTRFVIFRYDFKYYSHMHDFKNPDFGWEHGRSETEFNIDYITTKIVCY